MSQSTHQLAVKGVDNTQRAFSSIQARAAATGAAIRRAVGGAIAAAGAYLSFRAVASGVKTLGQLSDIAQKTSTSVDELTRATTGLNILGIATDTDTLAKAFQYMEKNTGRTGLKGFYETIGEIGKIPDTSERAQAAIKVFGRSGMEFMPLINAAKDSTNALEGVIAAMPGISAAAAKAGDDAADAMAIVGKSIHSIWLQALGKMIRLFAGDDEGSMRGAAAKAAAWLEYYAKVSAIVWQSAWRRIKGYSGAVVESFVAFGSTWSSGVGFLDAAQAAVDAWDAATREMREDIEALEKPMDDLGKNLAEKLDAISKLDIHYPKATESSQTRLKEDEEEAAAASRAPRIRNDLIMGGSYEALKIASRGPETMNEMKKQTEALKKIAKNTEKTADNTEDLPTPSDL